MNNKCLFYRANNPSTNLTVTGHVEETTAQLSTTGQRENTNTKDDSVTKYSDIIIESTKENDVITHSELNAAKNDDLVNGGTEGQDQSRKLVSMENEVTTEKSAPKEQAEEGKEYTTTMTKLTDDTTGRQITFIRELHSNKWFKIGEATIKYLVLPLVLPFLICNIISFIVMNLQHNRSHSSCVYLAALAGSDSAVLLHSVMVWSQLKTPAWSNYM